MTAVGLLSGAHEDDGYQWSHRYSTPQAWLQRGRSWGSLAPLRTRMARLDTEVVNRVPPLVPPTLDDSEAMAHCLHLLAVARAEAQVERRGT